MDRTLNVYTLYLNDLATGYVDKRGDFSSFSEAGEHVKSVIDEFLQERSTNGKTPEHIVIPKTGKVDNAFQTANWKVGFVIHQLADNRVEIHERYVSKPGIVMNSYATRLSATIGCLEIVVPLDADNAPVRKFVKPHKATPTRTRMMREFTEAAQRAKQSAEEQNNKRRTMLIQMTERLHEREVDSCAKFIAPVTNNFAELEGIDDGSRCIEILEIPEAPPAPTTTILQKLSSSTPQNVDIEEVKAVVAAREERRAAGEFDDFESLIPPPKPFHEAFLEAIKEKRTELLRPKPSAAVQTPKTERLLQDEIAADIQAFEVPKRRLRTESEFSTTEESRLSKHIGVSKADTKSTPTPKPQTEITEDELDQVLAMLEEEIEKYCTVPDMLRKHTDRDKSAKCVPVSVIRENLGASVAPTKFEIIDISLPIRQIYQVDLYKHLRRRPTYSSDEGETDSDGE